MWIVSPLFQTNNLISSEDDAAMALQVSKALTSALLKYRLKSVPSDKVSCFFDASLCMSVSVLMHSVPVLRVFRMCYFCSPERLLVCMTWWPFSMIQYIAPQCDGLRLISSFSAAHMRSSSCIFCHEVTVHGWRDIQIQELSALWEVRQVLFAIQLIGVMRDFTERSCWF